MVGMANMVIIDLLVTVRVCLIVLAIGYLVAS